MPLPRFCTKIHVNPLFTANGLIDATGTFGAPTLTASSEQFWAGIHLTAQAAVLDAARSSLVKNFASNDGAASLTGTLVPSNGLVIRLE